jgi:membrane-associated protease RseP (regulator of RpoE activity)
VSEDPRFRVDAPAPARRRFWFVEHPLFHLALFLLTLATTTIAGGLFSPTGGLFGRGNLADGLPYSVPLLLILGSHELGHYFTCRHYGYAATLPYFLPSPFTFGTFGAIIRIKQPIRDKKHLFDIGIAGPVTGFAVAIPMLLYGVTRARPAVAPGGEPFGYPLAVQLAQLVTGTPLYTSETVYEHPTFMAAWLGLLVTALNLLPIGQLDGGHALRALVGARQPAVSRLVVIGAAATLYWTPTWGFFALLVFAIMGVGHPALDSEEAPLGRARTAAALGCLAIFLLSFSLVPVRWPWRADAPSPAVRTSLARH